MYHQRLKMARAQELLETDRFSVKEIAYALGYKHPNDFSRAFKQFVGKSPKSIGDNQGPRNRSRD
jgi:two-component system response regulator YesN